MERMRPHAHTPSGEGNGPVGKNKGYKRNGWMDSRSEMPPKGRKRSGELAGEKSQPAERISENFVVSRITAWKKLAPDAREAVIHEPSAHP
jgi:hypothetical protein